MKAAPIVFILFTALAAFTFCTLSLGYAKSNIEMSKKVSQRNEMYYELDADAQRFLLFVDETLSDAETFAVEYICAEGYSSKIYQNMPADVQTTIYEKYTAKKEADNFDPVSFISDVLNSVYSYKAYTWLQERRESLFYALLEEKGEDTAWQSPDIHVVGMTENENVNAIKITGKFFSASDFNYHLTVDLTLFPLLYDISYSEILVEGVRAPNSKNYEINRWDEVYTQTY